MFNSYAGASSRSSSSASVVNNITGVGASEAARLYNDVKDRVVQEISSSLMETSDNSIVNAVVMRTMSHSDFAQEFTMCAKINGKPIRASVSVLDKNINQICEEIIAAFAKQLATEIFMKTVESGDAQTALSNIRT